LVVPTTEKFPKMEGKPAGAPERRVEPNEISERFNESGLFERVLRGELETVLEDDRFVRDEVGLPQGARSQMVWYLGPDGQKLVLVHQYLLPDGSIGGSGRPDPKRMILDDEVIYC